MTTNLFTDIAAIAGMVSLIALPAVAGSYNQFDMLAGLSTDMEIARNGFAGSLESHPLAVTYWTIDPRVTAYRMETLKAFR